jgi:RNA polymerase sigma-70 factor (ECF subfamily)
MTGRNTALPTPAQIDALYRTESRRVLATLIRVLGDFDLAEEALHDAFRAAVEQWPAEGMPANPRAWLVSAGRFKAIDGIRRRTRFEAAEAEIADRLYATSEAEAPWQEEELEDDRLRLIFTCCHPALPPEARIALTLREVCGLSTEEIARAYLTTPPTLAQRIVRAKAKIKAAGIPYEVPLRGVVRCVPDAARPLCGGHSPRSVAGGTAARTRGHGAPRVDAAA